MTMMEKIQKILDEKVEDKKEVIIDEAVVEYVLDEEGQPELDEDGNKIVLDEKKENPFAKKDDKKEDDDSDDSEDSDDKKDKKDKKDDEVDVKEDLEKIFAKTEIDPEIKEALETLFNVAVDQKVVEKYAVLEDTQTQYMNELVEDVEQRVDKYVSYVAEEWLKENEVEIETGIKVEISENLIGSLKGIFEDSYVEVPESKVDLVKEAEETIDSLLTSIDEGKEQIGTLQIELHKIKATKIVDEMSSEMTDTQKEKLGTLIDSVEYMNDSDYTEKVKVVIESYFNEKVEDKEDKTILDEEVKTGELSDRMASYVKQIQKK